jgi:hypothetical protein
MRQSARWRTMPSLMWRRYARRGTALAVAALLLACIPAVPRSNVRARAPNQSTSATVDVAIRATRNLRDALDARGARIGTDLPAGATAGGRVLTASIGVAMLPEISHLPGVQSVTVGDRLAPQLDQATSAAQTGAAAVVRNLTDHLGRPVTGRGVLIGIADTGIDWSHADFRRADGGTRLVGLWDQNAPAGGGANLPAVTYGRAWSAAQVDAWIAAGILPGDRCPTAGCLNLAAAGVATPDDRPIGSSALESGHGTHVLAGAASGGLARSCDGVCSPTFFQGVAPEADLAVVRTDLSTAHVIDAWSWLVSVAKARGQPLVIVNALAVSRAGAHDGSHPLEVAIDALSGPGVSFVTAAGNAGGLGAHASGTLLQPGTIQNASFAIYTDPEVRTDATVDIWWRGSDDLEFAVQDPYGATAIDFTSRGSAPRATTTAGGVAVTFTSASTPSGPSHAVLTLHRAKTGVTGGLGGMWTLIVRATSLGVGDRVGQWDAWIDLDSAPSVRWLSSAESGKTHGRIDTTTLAEPATARQAIVVGAFASRASWVDGDGTTRSTNPPIVTGDVAAFSGRGPTVDGLQRPDVVAPGAVVVAARSATDATDPRYLAGSAGRHRAASGTSVAAGQAAGVVALLMQLRPSLSPNEARAALRDGAASSPLSGWDPSWGAGKLRAPEPVSAVLAMPVTATPTPGTAATPTATATSPPTSSPTPGATATATATPSPTSSPTPGATATATATPSPTSSPTSGATTTATATPSPTSSPTPGATATATATSPSLAGATATSTPAPAMSTPTATDTALASTASASATRVALSTATPSASPTATASRTPTATSPATASRTSTPTRTATPVGTTELLITMSLWRAAPPPAPSHAVSAHVSVYLGPSLPGTRVAVYETDATANQSGIIDLLIPGLDGYYDVVVRPTGAISHERSAVSLRPHAVKDLLFTADEFREGDLDGNDRIDQADLDRLVASYGKRAGDDGFDAAADLDRDGEVSILDVSAIVRGLGLVGPIPVG